MTALLQSEKYATLRAIGCDCLGNIGSDIFEHLPVRIHKQLNKITFYFVIHRSVITIIFSLQKDKQILVITLLFASSRDEENSVKGAAVRALAISVLYPSLQEVL